MSKSRETTVTAPLADLIRGLFLAQMSDRQIRETLHLSVHTFKATVKAFGLARPAAVPVSNEKALSRTMEPLPAGHEISLSCINRDWSICA
jgi:hypothetical protein